jgi:hypothetical protein
MVPYTVAIVATPDFGEALERLADRLHVWITATPPNRARAEAYWRAHPGYSLEAGITTFWLRGGSPEDEVQAILPDVDVHHGEYSHTPPWSALEIYGASPTPSLRETLASFGVDNVEPLPGGFRCSRGAQGAV